ncbi:dGTPase [Acinetobacter sp. YH16031]|uniref:dGTPase n=1 Tax=Acinetobacter sp. YH16031 TaxID=2601180 RepID=UPI0015D3A950|nr:dGTPase [Acinetobacter sp. YH16031]
MQTSVQQVEKLFSYLKADRLRSATRADATLLEAAESDRGRVINAAAFRRLQQKAQVFPLEANASVRSRLTHSFEVSQVGRYIAQSIISTLLDQHPSLKTQLQYDVLTAFVSTVETACLLHDLGNPPFGHLGEAAIQEWFTKFIADFEGLSGDDKKNHPLNDIKLDEFDLTEFDGNPQGYRIVNLLNGEDCHGLNLTSSLLLSIVKYPWSKSTKPEDKISKKNGLFNTSLDSYNTACNQLNWSPYKSFPYMQIMDMADEIAYSMSDLEDALDKKIISREELLKVFKEYCVEEHIDFQSTFGVHADQFLAFSFIKFKTPIIHKAVKEVAEQFCVNLEKILLGEKVDLLVKDSNTSKLLRKVKKIAIARIYSDPSAEKVELAGRNIIQGLLNHYELLLKLPKEKFESLILNENIRKNKLDFELRLFRRLPSTYVDKYRTATLQNPDKEFLYRAHLIVDYISGMTDDFALEMYQLLEGIRIQ